MTTVPLIVRIAQDDPHVEQDALDGQALRLLREAMPDGWTFFCTACAGDVHFRVWARGQAEMSIHGATIAEAADACRAALEAR